VAIHPLSVKAQPTKGYEIIAADCTIVPKKSGHIAQRFYQVVIAL